MYLISKIFLNEDVTSLLIGGVLPAAHAKPHCEVYIQLLV